jgi:glycine cleavage system H protein
MSELVFMMGEFAARVPTDRQYCPNHMWAQQIGRLYRFGFTAYAVRLLQDVYFLEWCVDEEAPVSLRQQIGSIESKKAESDLYAPAPGRLVRFNTTLMDDPSAINVDKYGDGWLFEMETDGAALLSPQAYVQHLDGVWESRSAPSKDN